jgi:hypothetical protein
MGLAAYLVSANEILGPPMGKGGGLSHIGDQYKETDVKKTIIHHTE